MSKRREVRDRRERRRRLRALTLIAIVVGTALVLGFLVIYPSIKPIGDVVTVTPFPRPTAQGRVLGDPQAPILIEVYADFQCFACAAFGQSTEQLLMRNYVATGKARLAFRQFPFLGAESFRAADASLCADAQGRFWDYHDILFANLSGVNQGAFTDRRLIAFAEILGLDMEPFRTCFDASLHRDEISAEIQAGKALGIDSTPTIVVNGQIVRAAAANLVPSYEIIAAAVAAALAGQPIP